MQLLPWSTLLLAATVHADPVVATDDAPSGLLADWRSSSPALWRYSLWYPTCLAVAGHGFAAGSSCVKTLMVPAGSAQRATVTVCTPCLFVFFFV